MKSPTDKTIAFTFMALPLVPAADRWTAKLTFPPGSGPETELSLAVTDAAGGPLASGSFELAGRRIKVIDGQASVTFADFIRGVHETTLCLHRRGRVPAPGALTFG